MIEVTTVLADDGADGESGAPAAASVGPLEHAPAKTSVATTAEIRRTDMAHSAE
jgi:hypothetical protein